MCKGYCGKFRAIVRDNDDPLKQGRLKLSVEDVIQTTDSTWALPCLPVTGNRMGLVVLPPVGANVWAEFENGDPDYPVWTGGWFDDNQQIPDRALNDDPQLQNILLQSAGGHQILISDSTGDDGGIQLVSSTGAKITITDAGITLTDGTGATVDLSGATVDVNNGALSVT